MTPEEANAESTLIDADTLQAYREMQEMENEVTPFGKVAAAELEES